LQFTGRKWRGMWRGIRIFGASVILSIKAMI
jgi:hypothetical protein